MRDRICRRRRSSARRSRIGEPVKTKDKGGRPAHAPDDRSRQMVEVLSGFGIPQDKIADVIGVDGKTLRRHYATELQRGAATVEAKLVGNLLKLAGGR